VRQDGQSVHVCTVLHAVTKHAKSTERRGFGSARAVVVRQVQMGGHSRPVARNVPAVIDTQH
jgi:hypothetical protein